MLTRNFPISVAKEDPRRETIEWFKHQSKKTGITFSHYALDALVKYKQELDSAKSADRNT